ncbi:MAG: UDP-N-acetylmuramoyl-tripeptide--D-alanyl-D-alanine ligase [Bacteroidales bacterium]|nr:UDP-N-acetylmuramoyl-tripeptide--D-alanyl-D-alanine ligase [Bacteroidales bacterium]
MQLNHLHTLFLKNPVITTDTRNEIAGSIFFCLSGEKFNGNQFAKTAIEKGANYVIIDDPDFYIEDTKMILVENCLRTLQQLALYHRKQFSIPVIGITGTNGKTTTKELVTAVVASKFRVTSTKGNLNNHIGVPLTLLRITNQTEVAIIEMGANHAGEIDFLCSLALPNLGIITNIGKAHLEGFGSLETIKQTKLALYKQVAKQQGTLFVNLNDHMLIEEATTINHKTYGTDKAAQVRGKIIQEFPFVSLVFSISDQNYQINSQLVGAYNLPNILAAVTVGNFFKIDSELIIKALENYQPANNRSQFVKGLNNELIMDAYNANPDSLKLALENFLKDTFPKKGFILGDMLELGDFAKEEHLKVIEDLKFCNFELMIFVGPVFKCFEKEYTQFQFYETTTDCIASIQKSVPKQMRILIKGSRGIQLDPLQKILE